MSLKPVLTVINTVVALDKTKNIYKKKRFCMKNKLPAIMNKRIDFAINHYPVQELMPLAKRICGTDYGVSYYNNKNHLDFYHNEEAFRHALRRCISLGYKGLKEQIIKELNLDTIPPIEKFESDLLYSKRPFQKKLWDDYYNGFIHNTVDYIKDILSKDQLTMEDFDCYDIFGIQNRCTNCTYIEYKAENIDEYIRLFFDSRSDEYLIEAFCKANDFNKIAFNEEPLIRFIWEHIPIFKQAEDIEDGPLRDILVNNGLYLSSRWNLCLESETILKKIRSQLKKRELKECIMGNAFYGSDPGSYTKTDLKDLGFTESMIKELLPEPREKINPRFKNAAPMLLWWKDDVDSVIETTSFKLAYKVSEKRREAGLKAADTKRKRTLKGIEQAINDIQIPIYPVKILYEQSLNARIDFLYYQASMRSDGGLDLLNSAETAPYADMNTRKRWAVNYIRHELTDYDNILREIKGKVGAGEAYEKYKEIIMENIFEVYPELKYTP